MHQSVLPRTARITLDLDRLLAAGLLQAEEAERLRRLAQPPVVNRILANVLLIFGAFMVVAGILVLSPPLDVGLGLAVAALGIGGYLVFQAREEWGLLGQTLVLMGVVGLSGWAGLRFEELGSNWPGLVAPFIAMITVAGAIAFRNHVLAALAPIAVANLVGAGTAYWHASYALYVSEPTVTLLLFGALAALLFRLRPRLPDNLAGGALIAARVSFVMMNLGFWVGSLWGDHLGALWLAPTVETWTTAYRTWEAGAFFVPEIAFSLAWPVVLALTLYIGLRTHHRFIANASVVFLAIHAYTQFFEALRYNAEALVIGGAGLIVLGIVLFRFDRWQRERTSASAA